MDRGGHQILARDPATKSTARTRKSLGESSGLLQSTSRTLMAQFLCGMSSNLCKPSPGVTSAIKALFTQEWQTSSTSLPWCCFKLPPKAGTTRSTRSSLHGNWQPVLGGHTSLKLIGAANPNTDISMAEIISQNLLLQPSSHNLFHDLLWRPLPIPLAAPCHEGQNQRQL